MRTSVTAIVVGMVSGCLYGPYQFTCTDDASCGPGGRCEPSFNLCSFANPSCPSGRSFGSLGGAHAGQCVGSPGGSSPDASLCYGTGLVHVCLAAPPPLSVPIPTTPLNTTNSLLCASTVSGGTGYCVVAATGITIDAKLRATGTRPLVLIASGTLEITNTGMIDVGSHRGETPETGAGSDPAACGEMAGSVPGNGGGGAGGSFLGRGGSGGNGNGATAGGGASGAASVSPTVLRGGCSGQDGSEFLGVDTGAGGHGGGAVFLIAGSSIAVGGAIKAGGEGGAGGQQHTTSGSPDPAAGGGGGGAGGMIGLDAPSITNTGTLIANGGGGGEGNGSANSGGDGQDAVSTSVATGGDKGTSGGNGGNGGAGANLQGSSGNNAGNGFGGGGGGGGAGLIKAPANLAGPNVSPAPTP